MGHRVFFCWEGDSTTSAGSPADCAEQVSYYPVDGVLTSMLQRAPGKRPGPDCHQNGIWGATADVVIAVNVHFLLEASQYCPDLHTLPQEPQLFGSIPRSTHVPPQFAISMVQHFPALQEYDDPHAVPQEPQLFLSVFRSTQDPEHILVSPEHTHIPFRVAAEGEQ